jgi:hypothetical protein
MKRIFSIALVCCLGMMILGTFAAPRAAAQDPILTPIIINELEPIIVKVLTPKPKPVGIEKFEGTIVNSNIVQVTVRAKGNDQGIQTFALNQELSTKMQKIVDSGGYQYGDRVTIYYDASSRTAVKIKGKPSRPL